MTMSRQVQLRRDSTTLDLGATPYKLVAGSWASSGPQLEVRVIVEATTLSELRRRVTAIRQMLNQAQHYAGDMVGSAVYVYTKVCDDLSTTAELGATWLRKLIVAGGVVEPDASTFANGRYALTLTVALETEETWQRAAPESFLLASSSSTVVRSDGGLTVPASASLTARRMTWTAGVGVTFRVRWLYADADVTFIKLDADYDARALYLAGDNKLYIYDCDGNVASSTALNATAGAELDLVFKWDPVTPKMGIWVNGTANGSETACVLEFDLDSELVTNGGFEAGGTGGDFNSGVEVDDGTSDTFTGWTNFDVDDGAGNKIEATATHHAGSYAAKLTYTTTSVALFQSIAVDPGATYKLTFYARGDGTNASNFFVYASGEYLVSWRSTDVTGTDYTAVTKYFYVPEGTSVLELYFYATNVAGVAYVDAVSLKRILEPDTYTLIAPTGSAQSVYGVQLWPAALTDAQCGGLSAWGRPEPELAYYVAPADTKNTNAAYRMYNVPGEADARLRLLLSDVTQAYDKFRVGIRPLRIQTATLWECEDGTNGAAVLDAVDATASAGNVAQFTPADTNSAARSTVVIAANPADMRAYYGQYRLLLAVKDNAAGVGINLIKWRLICAGTAEDYSAEYAVTTMATYSLLDLDTLTLPPGTWPDETENCITDVHAGSYLTLEIAVRNTAGVGGGTLNLDAIYLQPVEIEGQVECTAETTSTFMTLDFASETPAAVGVADARSLEYAHWGEYTGDDLTLPPVTGAAGLLCVYAYRDTAETAYPNDAVTVYPFLRPGWL